MGITTVILTCLRGFLNFLRSPNGFKALVFAAALAGAGLLYADYASTRKHAVELSEALRVSNERIANLEKSQKASEQAILTRNELLDAISSEETVERAETIKAIKANPEWADQPIPADVLRSLRK